MINISEAVQNAMGGFFKNVGSTYNGSKYVITNRNFKQEIDGYKIYTTIVMDDNLPNFTRSNCQGFIYTPIWQYFNDVNRKYANLTFKVKINKVKSDFGNLINFNGLSNQQIANAFLNWIGVIADANAADIIGYLKDYTNIRNWEIRSSKNVTLSYGATTEIILIAKDYNDRDDINFKGIAFSITKC